LFIHIIFNSFLNKLGRAPAFLVGCIILVLSRAMTSEEAFLAIDLGTLVFLMGMTLIVEILEEQRALKLLGKGLIKLGNVSALWAIVFVTGIVSAFLTNDGTCILLTPFILKICKQKNINPRPYLMAVASASNIGSAATLTGNPQNVIIGDKGGIQWLYFFKLVSPAAFLGLLCNAILLHLYYSREVKIQRTQAVLYGEIRRSDELHTRFRVQQIVVDPAERARLLEDKVSGVSSEQQQQQQQNEEDDRQSIVGDDKSAAKIRRVPKWIEQLLSVLAVLGLTIAYVFGESVPWVTLAVGLFVLGVRVLFTKDKVAASRISMKALANIDWSLLAFFGGNFIVIEAFNSTHIPHTIYSWVRSLGGSHGGIGDLLLLCALTMALSQVVGKMLCYCACVPRGVCFCLVGLSLGGLLKELVICLVVCIDDGFMCLCVCVYVYVCIRVCCVLRFFVKFLFFFC
jgi:Na+/H+ antiporter NhaD/arsenite permease-like protein